MHPQAYSACPKRECVVDLDVSLLLAIVACLLSHISNSKVSDQYDIVFVLVLAILYGNVVTKH